MYKFVRGPKLGGWCLSFAVYSQAMHLTKLPQSFSTAAECIQSEASAKVNFNRTHTSS